MKERVVIAIYGGVAAFFFGLLTSIFFEYWITKLIFAIQLISVIAFPLFLFTEQDDQREMIIISIVFAFMIQMHGFGSNIHHQWDVGIMLYNSRFHGVMALVMYLCAGKLLLKEKREK